LLLLSNIRLYAAKLTAIIVYKISTIFLSLLILSEVLIEVPYISTILYLKLAGTNVHGPLFHTSLNMSFVIVACLYFV
jgi:hypothetical protein